MASAFDPYHEWLKIPPSEQPPNHYRLLETARFESDPEIIEAAVSRLVAKLQNLSNGQQVAHAQRILNDVAKARLCLSDPQKKLAYDQQLRQQLGFGKLPGSESAATPKTISPGQRNSTTPPPRAAVDAVASTTKTKKIDSANDKASVKSGTKNKVIENSKPKTSIGVLLGYVIGILVIASAATTFLVIRSLKRQDQQVATKENNVDRESEPPISKPPISPKPQNQPPQSKPAQTSETADAAFDQSKSTEKSATSHAEGSRANADPKTEVANAVTTKAGPESPNPMAKSPPAPETTPVTEPPLPTSLPTPQSTSTDGIVYLQPAQLDVFASRLGELAHLEGVPVKATVSKSEKTRYLRFSDDWNKTVMVYMSANEVGDGLSMENLNVFVGKKIRVHGEVKAEFGSKKIGLWVQTKDQIELVE